MYRFFIFLLTFTAPSIVSSDDLTPSQDKFFETKIRPVLVNACYECHSKESGQNEGGLVLDTAIGLRLGGNSGRGVVPHNLEESWLWIAISHSDSDYKMPPKGKKLPANVIDNFKTWIEMGAPDPRGFEEQLEVDSNIDIEVGRKFWSFQMPRKAAPPETNDADWSKSEIDRFVRAGLDRKRLTPVGQAEPTVLLRRLYFDLIGLPPSPSAISRFKADWEENSVRAVEATIDKLLASERYGERWGRHWMDVARYAESNGKQSNQAYPFAWRYRDYVIDSFNEDKPFNRFVQEQIAGDLLPASTDEQWQEGIIATGFLALGPKDLREKSSRQLTMDIVDEQIDATTQGILGLTVSCARCHDHKTDPIPTADYYALSGIFLSSTPYYGTSGNNNRFNQSDLLVLPLQGKSDSKLTTQDIARIKERLTSIERGLTQAKADKRSKMNGQAGNAEKKRSNASRLRREQTELEGQLASVTQDGFVNELAMGMQDKDVAMNANILVRGEIDTPAQVVPRGFLQVLNHDPQQIHENRSGRIELANWLASEQNPLTARVIVNRVWDKLFGRGLVSSTNNFGTTGMAPTDPELLDYLAVEFMNEGWSIKSLIRKIVLTRTYQSSARFNADNYEIDPDNEYLWRAAPRRLDAEALRDAILAATGELDLTRPVGSRVNEAGKVELGRKGSPDLMVDLPPMRSVYLPAVRNGLQEMIQLFDGPDTEAVTGHRDATNVAGQALYLLNSDFILKQADLFADKLLKASTTTKGRIELAFLRTVGRMPTENEMQSTVKFYKQFIATVSKETRNRQEAERLFLSSVCQGLIASAEFRFIN